MLLSHTLYLFHVICMFFSLSHHFLFLPWTLIWVYVCISIIIISFPFSFLNIMSGISSKIWPTEVFHSHWLVQFVFFFFLPMHVRSFFLFSVAFVVSYLLVWFLSLLLKPLSPIHHFPRKTPIMCLFNELIPLIRQQNKKKKYVCSKTLNYAVLFVDTRIFCFRQATVTVEHEKLWSRRGLHNL